MIEGAALLGKLVLTLVLYLNVAYLVAELIKKNRGD